MYQNSTETRLSREELYELVWKEPMSTVAKSFGISDVAVAKKCRRLKIPVPGRGYWAKKKRGARPKLPPFAGSYDYAVFNIPVKKAESKAMNEYLNEDDVQKLLKYEELTENKIEVFQTLRNPHRLVVETKQALTNTRLCNYNRVATDSPLAVNIAPKSIDRAMRLMDALVKALDKRGFLVAKSVRAYHRETYVRILGQLIEISLFESSKENRTKLTPAQEKERQKHPWSYRHPYTVEFIPTGILHFKLDTWGGAQKVNWSDTESRKIESYLNDFVAGMVKVAAFHRNRAREEERLRQEREESRRLRQEKLKQIAEEQERVQELEVQAANLAKSKQIRELVAAVRSAEIGKNGEIAEGSSKALWIEWALKHADRIDPLVESPPSILDEAAALEAEINEIPYYLR